VAAFVNDLAGICAHNTAETMASISTKLPNKSSSSSLSLSSRLVSLFVIHRGLSCHDESASDAENYEKVLFYHPGKSTAPPCSNPIITTTTEEGMLHD